MTDDFSPSPAIHGLSDAAALICFVAAELDGFSGILTSPLLPENLIPGNPGVGAVMPGTGWARLPRG